MPSSKPNLPNNRNDAASRCLRWRRSSSSDSNVGRKARSGRRDVMEEMLTPECVPWLSHFYGRRRPVARVGLYGRTLESRGNAMCFAPEADAVAGAIIVAVGVDAL